MSKSQESLAQININQLPIGKDVIPVKFSAALQQLIVLLKFIPQNIAIGTIETE